MSRGSWYRPSPAAGLNGLLTPLRIADLGADYSQIALAKSDSAGAGKALSSESEAARIGVPVASYEAGIAKRLPAVPAARNAAVYYQVHNTDESHGAAIPSKITILLREPYGEWQQVGSVDLRPNDAFSDSWKRRLRRFLCLSLPSDQWPSYLVQTCAPRGADPQRAQKARDELVELAQVLLPSPLQLALDKLSPKDSVLQLLVPPELLNAPFSELPFHGRPLGERFTVTFATSMDISPPRPRDRPGLVILKSSSTLVQLNPHVRDTIAFAQLDTTAIQLAVKVAGLMGAELLADDSVRKRRIRRTLGRFPSLHFVTHGSLAPSAQWGYLVVAIDPDDEADQTPGALSSDEIRLFSVAGAVITLASCESAIDVGSSDYYGSVAGAFLFAGARAVIGTRWQVRESSAGIFMEEFYKQRFLGMDEVAAFASALRALQATGNPDVFAYVLLRRGLY